ncbi:MAG: DMT family transporter [Bacteroidota bacterium]
MTEAVARDARVPGRVWAVLVVGLTVLGASAILIRLAGVEGETDFRALVVWRLLFTVAILAPVGLRRGPREEIAALGRRDLALVAAAGALLAFHFLGWFSSLAFTSVASATVLVTMSPIFIAILGAVFLRESPRRWTWIAIATGVAGAALISLGDARGGVFPQAALGNALAFGAALCIAVYLLVGRAVRQRVSFGAYFFPVNVVVLLVVVAVAVAGGVSLALDGPTIALCLVMAVGPGLLGHGAFAYSVKYIPAATLGLLSLCEPVVSALLALVIFEEVPGAVALVGMAVVLASIAAVLWQSRRG